MQIHSCVTQEQFIFFRQQTQHCLAAIMRHMYYICLVPLCVWGEKAKTAMLPRVKKSCECVIRVVCASPTPVALIRSRAERRGEESSQARVGMCSIPSRSQSRIRNWSWTGVRAEGNDGETYAEWWRGGVCEQEVRGEKVTVCHVKRWREVEERERKKERRRLFYSLIQWRFGTEKLAAFILIFPMVTDYLMNWLSL